METEKLYYADPFLTEFDARVLACEAVKDGFAVVLDRTAFYPEGGGQPYDTGVLGGAEVLDVHEKAGVIKHKCASPLPVGAAVHGKIDRARRFDHMQQHSGEHICSGLICARYGCDNVGFHMGAESVTIDFNADIPWEELLEIEAAANRYIYEDHAIDIQLHRGAELDAIDYRSKKPLEGDVLLFEDELGGESVRRLCDAVAETCGGRCAVFAGAGSAWKYAIVQRGGDLRALTKELNAALSGRGGGKPEFVQGSVGAEREAIEAFFAEM